MARVVPLSSVDDEEKGSSVDDEEKRKKEAREKLKREKKVTLKDDEFMKVFEENKRKYGLIPEKEKKVWHGKVNVDPDVIEPGKVLYSQQDFLDIYEHKYRESDDDLSGTESEDDAQSPSVAVTSASKSASIPSPSIAHQDLAITTNPEGDTKAEKELYALAGSMAGSKKLDEKLYVEDEKRLKKQKRKKEIEELTQDDPWYVKLRRIVCCEHQPGHKRRLKEEQEFIYHVKNEDIFAVKSDLDKRSDPNFRDRDGKTALILACFMGATGIANNLMRYGADPNLRDFEKGMTALHYASMRGYRDLCQRLVAEGADVDCRDNAGLTPLMHAVKNGELPTVKELMNLEAHLHHVDNKKWSAMHYAAWSGHFETVVFLYNEGAWLNKPDAMDKYPVDYAKEHRHKLVAEIIMEMENGTFNERKYDGMTPDEIARANRFE